MNGTHTFRTFLSYLPLLQNHTNERMPKGLRKAHEHDLKNADFLGKFFSKVCVWA